MKAADFSFRFHKNSVHLRTIQTMIWLVGWFVCLFVGWFIGGLTTVHLTTQSLAKIYTVLVVGVSRYQCWNDADEENCGKWR